MNALSDIPAFSRALDAMTHEQRVTETRALPGALLQQLFERAAGLKSIGLSDLVPSAGAALSAVRHLGTNSLPFFRGFEKVMYRAQDGAVFGRNVQTWEAVTGPGYFSARAGDAGEVLFDYVTLPKVAPDGWPRISDNGRGLSRFVFGNLKDVLRGVSAHVTIGRAFRGDAPMNQYFVLVRVTSQKPVAP